MIDAACGKTLPEGGMIIVERGPICFRFSCRLAFCADSRTFWTPGSAGPIRRIADVMAMTPSSSLSVERERNDARAQAGEAHWEVSQRWVLFSRSLTCTEMQRF